ncbi:FAD-dependent oxidoreductase [Areca yellow leaf disease phytoplasma]|uniref:FAD-dependent oxidoreductase n=1 Tax=Areca yellow leaf disease phytoplasma TaxID=927614 RepID=UPI0035B54B23
MEGLVNTQYPKQSKFKESVLKMEQKLMPKTVIITTGTYLASQILIGDTKNPRDLMAFLQLYGISVNQLKLKF